MGRYDKTLPGEEIQDFLRFKESLRCFAWVRGTKLTGAADADALIERNDRLLLIEGKSVEGKLISVPWGQWRALRAFAAKPDCEVWVVGELGPESAPVKYAVGNVHELARKRYRVYPYKGSKAIRIWLDDLELLTAEEWTARCDAWWDGPWPYDASKP